MSKPRSHRNDPPAKALALAEKFSAVLPSSSILTNAEDLHPYECDGLSAYRRTPMMVILPDCIEQIQNILRICHSHNIPVVARGAGTGLSGGALPLADGVLLSLAKLNQILEIDPDNRTANIGCQLQLETKADAPVVHLDRTTRASELM